jgi:predicted phosphodiesterase
MDVEAVLRPAGVHEDAPHRGHRHPAASPVEGPTITAERSYGDAGVHAQPDGTDIIKLPLSAENPSDIPDAAVDEDLRRRVAECGYRVRDGYELVIDRVRYYSAGWHRKQGPDGTGLGQAYSGPAYGVELRAVPKAAPTASSAMDDPLISDVIGSILAAAQTHPSLYAPVAETSLPTGESASLVVALCDWQMGQADGDHTIGLLRRLALIPTVIIAKVRAAIAMGVQVTEVVLAALGDLIEACWGHYANQQSTVKVDWRRQIGACAAILAWIIRAVRAAFPAMPIRVIGVPGNHGEIRQGGKQSTGSGDNMDVLVVELARGIVGEDPGTTWHVTDDRGVLTIDVQGLRLVALHGHQFDGKGATQQAKATNWIKSQASARTAAGDGDVYICGHLHTPQLLEIQGRAFMQANAMCDSSLYFAEAHGLTGGGPGLTSMWVTAAGVRAFDDYPMPVYEPASIVQLIIEQYSDQTIPLKTA